MSSDERGKGCLVIPHTFLSSNVGILFQNLEISNGNALEKWHTASYVYRTDLQLQQVLMQFL